MKQLLLISALFISKVVFSQTEPTLLFPLCSAEALVPVTLDYDWNGQPDMLSPNGVLYLNPGTAASDWMVTNIVGAVPQFAHDFTGDGLPDIICGNAMTGSTSLRLAINNGSDFVSFNPLSDSYNSDPLADDIDGDGDFDILAGSHLLVNDGAGNFIDTDFGGTTQLNATGDIDGDGLKDLATTQFVNYDFGVIANWRKNLGGGVYDDETPLNLPADNEFIAFNFFDFDNDGDDDITLIVTLTNEYELRILENDGNGNYSNLVDYNTTLPNFYYLQIEKFDIDNDGDLDAATSDGTIVVNNNDGSFNVSNNLNYSSLMNYIIGQGSFYSTPSSVFGGIGMMSHMSGTSFYIPFIGATPDDNYIYMNHGGLSDKGLFSIDDYNNDGLQDGLAMSRPVGYALEVSSLKAVSDSKWVYDYGVGDYNMIYADLDWMNAGYADWDNNGTAECAGAGVGTAARFDIVASEYEPQNRTSLPFYLYDAGYAFTSFHGKIIAEDLNQDGLLDMMATLPGPGLNWNVLMNQGGSFAELSQYTTVIQDVNGADATSGLIAFLDINGDNLKDFWDPVGGSALIQAPGFTFSQVVCPVNPAFASEEYQYNPDNQSFKDDAEYTDFNNDGYMDFVINGSIFLNVAGTGFDQFDFVPISGTVKSELWDASGDGVLDIISFSNVGIFYMENLGDGTFANAQIMFAGGEFSDTATMDWDSDGDDELLLEGIINNVSGFYLIGAVGTTQEAASVEGVVFIDDNANNIFDTGEIGLNQAAVGVAMNGQYQGVHFTNPNGNYSFPVLALGNCELQFNTILSGLIPAMTTATFVTNEGEHLVQNFPCIPTATGTQLDLNVNHYTLLCGQQNTVYIVIYNSGLTTPDANVTFDFSSDFTFNSSYPIAAAVSATQATFQLFDLPRYQYTIISMVLTNPGASFSGASYSVTATLDVTDDLTYPDQTETLTNTVTCSYDPNDITELTGYTDQLYVNGTDELEYRIRFQNTGTAEAIRVEIQDQLPSEVDPTTLVMSGVSHEMTSLEIDQNRMVHFVFENIHLPDSASDQLGSNGYIQFSILPIAGLNHEDEISNAAAIYFDGNEPVITNTVVNHVFDCNTFNAQFEVTGGVDCFQQHAEMNYNPEWVEQISWQVNDIETSNDNTISFADITENFTLKLEASNPLCGTVTQESIISAQEILQPQIDASTTEFCEGYEAILTSNFDANNEWYLNDNLLSTNSTINVNASGDYVLVIHDGDCVSDEITQTIVVNPAPASPEVTTVDTYMSTPEVAGYSYQWYFNGEVIVGATASDYAATESGNYSLVVSDANGCTATSSIQNIVIGIRELSSGEISVYPNPATDWVIIDFGTLIGTKRMQLINAIGEVVYDHQFNANKVQLDLSAFSLGLYTIQVSCSDGMSSRLLVITK